MEFSHGSLHSLSQAKASAAAKEDCEEEEQKMMETDAEATPAESAERKPESTEAASEATKTEPPPTESELTPTEAAPASKTEEEELKEEKPPPDFETVVTSVADLRVLITSLTEESSNSSNSNGSITDEKRPATRRGSAEAAKAEEGVHHLLLEQLRILLSEWEAQEAVFQQADAALRTRLHREWHQPDTQDIHGSEDAVDSWTMHYKDEYLDEDSSSDESMSQEECNNTGDDQEEEAEVQEDCKDGSGWRVLRKRKIALSLPNGLTNSDEEVPASQPSNQPSSQPSRVTCQVATQTVSPVPTPPPRPVPAVSKESVPAVPKQPVAKTPVPHILARNSTSALMSTMTASSSTWIRPFARPQVDPPRRLTDHHKRPADQHKRPTKVRSLLEAGYTTFTEPTRPSTPQTAHPSVGMATSLASVVSATAPASVVTAAAPASVVTAAAPASVVTATAPASFVTTTTQASAVTATQVMQEQVVMPEEAQGMTAVQESVPEDQSLPPANDIIMEDLCMQDQEQRPAQKTVLVPAVDNSGQEILLHVEYTTIDEASLGNNLQSLPLPTGATLMQNLQMAPPVVQSVPMVQSLMQTLPVSTSTMNIPAMSSLVQTLAVTSSSGDVCMASPLVQTSPVTTSPMELSTAPPPLMQTLPVSSSDVQPSPSLPSSVYNHRREGLITRQRGPPWWKHSNTPSTTKSKEVPPLAPISAPRKIFKSRNMAAMSNNVCSSMDGAVGAVPSGVPASRNDVFVSSQQQHQQLIGSNGSQQLVFVVPQSPPKQQQVVLQQPEVPAVSQDMISQLIPMTQAPPADEPQQPATTMLLQAAVQNTLQTPILILTSDGHLLQVVQQPS
ncbi:hypothetical protein HPB50_009113 [Hyalomma asiaticum]|uniref:Uncharacterized protein n=1 Tax=Hyalomma asiaticum TaxID=266040 RepID=A0ACB7T3Y3_HYAAI|nr:hypothetical protein HPB50_009113 [Hyalomma asiaticum]